MCVCLYYCHSKVFAVWPRIPIVHDISLPFYGLHKHHTTFIQHEQRKPHTFSMPTQLRHTHTYTHSERTPQRTERQMHIIYRLLERVGKEGSTLNHASFIVSFVHSLFLYFSLFNTTPFLVIPQNHGFLCHSLLSPFPFESTLTFASFILSSYSLVSHLYFINCVYVLAST